ncbi:helix-turn-helix domain-containing protein [Candidatus Spongiihabitans sp.]|uniref:helix-turn-helix domain-containing protein n=1 Tax=Candidatus Spongiihabitans sp. TaxID=3101308 RepID=UPI003C7C688E
MSTLAERICESREKAGLSQADVAKSLRVSASAVNQWESGFSKNIKLGHFFALASLLHQDPQWLATGTVFPQLRRMQEEAPPSAQAAVSLVGEEKALLHHFRLLPAKLRKRLLTFVRGVSDLSVFECGDVRVDRNDR